MRSICFRYAGVIGERDGVADGLVERFVRAVHEQERLLPVRELVEVVPQLVVHGVEVIRVHLDAHLQAHVVAVVDRPRAGVADDVPIGGLGEERTLPERLRQRGEAERREEALSRAHDRARVHLLRPQPLGEVRTAVLAGGRYEIVDVAPLLCPGVPQQVGGNRPVRRHHRVAVALGEAAAHVGVQRHVERPDLLPETLDFGGELVGRHVVVRPPHRARVSEPELARALVGQIDEADVTGPHRRRNASPPGPQIRQLLRIAAFAPSAARSR